jgi:hypothetical protein
MAMEINRKKLHVHALPLVAVVAILFVMALAFVGPRRASINSGAQALFGKQVSQPKVNLGQAGQTASQSFKSK